MLKSSAAAILVAFLLQFQPSASRLDTKEAISYLIEDGKGVPGYKDSDRELVKLALDAWSRESEGKLKFTEAAPRGEALIRFRWISPNEGLYGETQRISVRGKV